MSQQQVIDALYAVHKDVLTRSSEYPQAAHPQLYIVGDMLATTVFDGAVFANAKMIAHTAGEYSTAAQDISALVCAKLGIKTFSEIVTLAFS